MSRLHIVVLCFIIVIVGLRATDAFGADPSPVDFSRDILPILSANCFQCHGPDEKTRQGGRRLDTRDGAVAIRDGKVAVIPGKSAESDLIRRILSDSDDERMPPPDENRALTPQQVELLKRWIDDGASWSKHWAFVPPARPEMPTIRNPKSEIRNAIDTLILARLEQTRMPPSPEADRGTLLRRISFDLTGLPPTPDELDIFLADASADAYERQVQRLLDSPRFGERMASLWLPLARYAEDQAHQVGSDTSFFYPNAYRYRAWVIDAFNRDLPYDQFVRLQLAADKIEGTAPDDWAALGFLGLGPKYYNRKRLEVMADEWEDRVDTVSRTFLGLTVACARCHDHKYDPIRMDDYYALAGVFASTKMVNKSTSGKAETDNTEAKKMSADTLHIVEDDSPRDLNVFLRGNVESKGPVAARRFLRVLSDSQPVPFRDGSGRKELAEAITHPDNPLTARVLVNRVWDAFFGQPLVSTPSNFGALGERPTHPELLDDMAVRFRDGGWSIKSLVREIVLSATYRQTSRHAANGWAVDPANTLLSRMNRRRLSVEQWRDSVLFVTGQLEVGGGPSMELDDQNNHRRTVYARVSRLKLNDLLMQFDYPDANVHAEKRAVTTTATQRLFFLNSPFVLQQAQRLAARLTADPQAAEMTRISQSYRRLFGREPSEAETRLALDFLTQPGETSTSRWEQYAQMLLVSNEVLYVD